MTLFDMLTDPDTEERPIASRIDGVVIGIVTNNQDPEKLGRVKLMFPWLSDEDESTWARVAAPMAGAQRGFYFLPEVDDEVLVAFEHGDLRFPYVLGGLWNGKDKPPVEPSQGNHVRELRSRSGHVVRLNDEDGKETIELIDKSENNSLVFDTASNTISITAGDTIRITAEKGIELKSEDGTISLEAKTIAIKSSADTLLEADTKMDVKASAAMTIKGSVVNIN